MKQVLGLVVLAAAVAGVYFLNDALRHEDGRSILYVARELPITVDAAHAEHREIIRTVQAPGEVEAFNEVDISSEVMGKIVEMPVEEGDFVRAGDLLCRLDDADYRARVLSAEANVARLEAMIKQAEAELVRAELDWEQVQRLRESSATSASEVARYRSTLVGAQAALDMRRQELRQAHAALESAREDLRRTVITSPIDGVVSQLFAKAGEVVITGTMNNPGTRVMVVSDLGRLQVRCRVDEADATLVDADQNARIYLQSDTRRSVSGRVLRVGTKGTRPIGRDVVTFETLVLIEEADERVRPGMSANVEIEVARRAEAVTLPIEAVVYRKRSDLPAELVAEYDRRRRAGAAQPSQHLAEFVKLVFCVVDGRVAARLVETGINDAARVEILEGVALGDEVVTGPYRSLDQLKDGAAVRIERRAPSEPQPSDVAAGQERREGVEDGAG